jgi:hypothetical protein
MTGRCFPAWPGLRKGCVPAVVILIAKVGFENQAASRGSADVLDLFFQVEAEAGAHAGFQIANQ